MGKISNGVKWFISCSLCICMIVCNSKVAKAGGQDNIVDTSDGIYTYEEMLEDIALLAASYPDYFHYEVVGKSWDSRMIFKLVVGNPDAANSVFVEAGTHAREYMNCMLVMKQAQFYLQNLDVEYANQLTYRQILDNCNIVMIPMVNPDGISISQYGPNAIVNPVLRANLNNMPGVSNPSRWKANGNGVDLNRNWNVFWNREISYTSNSGGNSGNPYNGPYAESEPEILAMKSVIEDTRYNWVGVISFHSMEGAIYYLLDYYPNDAVKFACAEFALDCKKLTGYKMVNYEVSRARGLFYNYTIINKGLRTVCIETGYKPCPLPTSQWNGVWKSNWQVPIFTALKYGMR